MPDEPKTQLEAALAAALPKLDAAKKSSSNPHFRSKYADLASVIEAVRPIAEQGIWFRQVLHEGADGVTVETLYTGFGATISAGTLFMPAGKKDAQGFGSALTYARRYALQTAFGLATEDDDGNAAAKSAEGRSQEGAVSPRQAKRQPQHSALKTELRGFVHELNGAGDGDELSAFLATPDAIRIIKETREKLPHLWDGEDWPEGSEKPEEFVPLSDQIGKRQQECAEVTASYLRA